MNGEHPNSPAPLATDPVSTLGVRNPTHRCKICGAYWILYPPNHHVPAGHPERNGTWSLGTNEKCGPCCDNVAMGEQIEELGSAYALMCRRATFPPQRSDPATWVLYLLLNNEISVAKAREWLRHYIQDGVKDPLPDVEALP